MFQPERIIYSYDCFDLKHNKNYNERKIICSQECCFCGMHRMCEAHDIMNAKLFARKDVDFAECIECAKHMI